MCVCRDRGVVPEGVWMNTRVAKLTNPPLIEAWLEMRWNNRDADNRFFFHAHEFTQRILPSYPIGEATDNVEIPESLSPERIRYRFRQSIDGYPLVQIGPAVASVNFGRDYTWNHFLEEAKRLRSAVLACFPNSAEGTYLSLRYRNVYPFDPNKEDLSELLSDKFHVKVDVPPALQELSAAGSVIQRSYRLPDLPGVGTFQIGSGLGGDDVKEPVIVWELSALSMGEDTPRFDDDLRFVTWLDMAHKTLEAWFFGLIEGDLYDVFTSNEQEGE